MKVRRDEQKQQRRSRRQATLYDKKGSESQISKEDWHNERFSCPSSSTAPTPRRIGIGQQSLFVCVRQAQRGHSHLLAPLRKVRIGLKTWFRMKLNSERDIHNCLKFDHNTNIDLHWIGDFFLNYSAQYCKLVRKDNSSPNCVTSVVHFYSLVHKSIFQFELNRSYCPSHFVVVIYFTITFLSRLTLSQYPLSITSLFRFPLPIHPTSRLSIQRFSSGFKLVLGNISSNYHVPICQVGILWTRLTSDLMSHQSDW